VTTKTGIVGLTRAVALEAATTGITCNALCPGTLPTPAIMAKIQAAAVAEGHPVEQATSDYLATRQPSRGSLRPMASALWSCFYQAGLRGILRDDDTDRRRLGRRMMMIPPEVRIAKILILPLTRDRSGSGSNCCGLPVIAKDGTKAIDHGQTR